MKTLQLRVSMNRLTPRSILGSPQQLKKNPWINKLTLLDWTINHSYNMSGISCSIRAKEDREFRDLILNFITYHIEYKNRKPPRRRLERQSILFEGGFEQIGRCSRRWYMHDQVNQDRQRLWVGWLGLPLVCRAVPFCTAWPWPAHLRLWLL